MEQSRLLRSTCSRPLTGHCTSHTGAACHSLTPSSLSSLSFRGACVRAGPSKVACNGESPAASLGFVPSSSYMCHQAFLEGALVGASLSRDLPSHTHAHLACIYMYIHKSHRCLTPTYIQRPINVRDQLQGQGLTMRNASRGLWADTSRCLCRCQPWETLRPRRALGQRLT